MITTCNIIYRSAALLALTVLLSPAAVRADDASPSENGMPQPGPALVGGRSDAPPAETFDWSGWYAGGRVGWAAGSATTVTSSATPAAASSFGMLDGGVQLGYARPLGSRLVLGLESDLAFANFLDGDDRISRLDASTGSIEERIDARGSLRGRLGYRTERGLLYGTGGLAGARGRFVSTPAGSDAAREQPRFRAGWTAGAGLEIPIASRWTARLEYRYDRLARTSASFDGVGTASTVGVHDTWLGVSWHFGDRGGDAPREAADAPATDAPAADGADRSATRWNLHGQSTFVEQGYPGFRSPYQGEKSLSGSSQLKNTVSATAFLGVRPWEGGELYVNPELMQGFGLNDTQGVAGFPNGEAQRSNFPAPRFNLARAYLSHTFALGDEKERVEDGPNQLPGERSVSRVTVTAGKFAVTDFFLVNAYAGEPRTTFLNWNVYGGGSYDWTMDLLSWTWGSFVELNQKRWAVRAGYFLLPKVSNTNDFDLAVPRNGQYTGELELRHGLFGRPGKVQLFGWLSHGNIGSYPDALARAAATGGRPDIALTRGQDRFNYGFVVSAEQPVTDTLGLFARASWSPEERESMGWTDCGQSFAVGGALKGASWRRPRDTVGFAGLVEGLSPVARRYFAAGGLGTIIGDGALTYRPETIVETYYALSAVESTTMTLDYQLVVNPGYNADRGPVSIFALRLHAEF